MKPVFLDPENKAIIMSEIFSISGIDIFKEFSQIMIRGNKYEQLNQTFSKEISISLPKENLETHK